MKLNSIEIHQDNLYCQQCLNTLIIALSQIHNIEFLNINMNKKLIKLKYRDDDMNTQKIRDIIYNAVTNAEIYN
ncbi:MAG: hypothetical protein WCD89_08695 [Anaerocolumna sp.]